MPERKKVSAVDEVSGEQFGVGTVVAQQPSALENLPEHRLWRMVEVDDIDRAAKFTADRFHEFENERAGKRGIRQKPKIDITVRTAFATGARTEQDSQPNAGTPAKNPDQPIIDCTHVCIVARYRPKLNADQVQMIADPACSEIP